MRVAIVVLIGFVLRLAYLLHVALQPGFAWQDPDFYLRSARTLAEGPRGWHWTWDAVTLWIGGRPHVLPPLYPIFLSIFASFPYLPFTALFAQLLLSVGSIVLIFALGRRLHSPRAGLIAAAGYAFWALNIIGVWSTGQEPVYVPLVLLAFLLLARALQTTDFRVWIAAGIAFGFAALTRSMPLFFVPLAAALHVFAADDRRQAIRSAAALLAGLAIPTVPYVIALSVHLGQFTPIDSHGSIHLSRSTTPDDRALSIGETLGALAARIADSPVDYVKDSVEHARSLLHVNGGRVLQIYVTAGSYVTAIAWKVASHLTVDLLLVMALTLAPFGAVLSRERRLTALFELWILVNVAIASVGGFGGARLRTPFEPMLLMLAAVVLAGDWRLGPRLRQGSGGQARRYSLAAAAAVSLVLATVTIAQLPRSLRSWPAYGIEWLSADRARIRGTGGLNVLSTNGVVAFRVARAVLRPDSGDAHVTIALGSRPADAFDLPPLGSRECRYATTERDLVFVELTAARKETGDAVSLTVTPLKAAR